MVLKSLALTLFAGKPSEPALARRNSSAMVRWMINGKFARAVGLVLGGIIILSGSGSSAAERFEFKEPVRRGYRLAETGPRLLSTGSESDWLRVVSDDAATVPYQLGSKIILQLKPGVSLASVVAGDDRLSVVGRAAPGLYILQAASARDAAASARQFALNPLVAVSYPEMRRPIKLHHAYAGRPNDSYFHQQWHLENRATNGQRLGVDINARAAWPFSLGAGVTVAVADSGVDFSHPELLAAVNGMPHFNFLYGNTNAGPYTTVSQGAHGTSVAGIIAASSGNDLGIAGVAPAAGIVSWAVLDFNSFASESQLADMFQSHSNSVAVQNHSWSYSWYTQIPAGLLEEVAISNAVHFGRAGKGVIMVRSAGNDRPSLVNANDDGYTKNPLVIAVGSVRQDGQVTSYSNPGACLLVAAPSGDASAGFDDVWTTDLLGNAGASSGMTGDLNDYRWFSGTSASAPMVSGIVALLLEANPALTYRDVQQILINAARQTDPSDPLIVTNQAGFRVSPNTGFGVPDAGRAVRLARDWPLRPAVTSLVFANDQTNQIPNQGLRIETFGDGVPLNLASIEATPGVGLHPETLTPFYPLVDVGLATNAIALNLAGKAALIGRGGNSFLEKINFAADAGARLAVIANYPGTNAYELMAGTHRARIPAVFIAGDDGGAFRAFLDTNAAAQVRAIVYAASYTNHVSAALLVEHVGVRVKVEQTHIRRGDLRITVTSPAGTRSVLQPVNTDPSSGPADWTYWSTHHFYESSQGIWTISISDEDGPNNFGLCNYSELILRGVPVTDQDRDGLPDDWELAHFQNLSGRPAEDADDDGETNMSEYLHGTNPLTPPGPFLARVMQWSPEFLRLSWPASPNRVYQVLGATNVATPFNVLTNLPGSHDYGEWFVPSTEAGHQFFMIRSALP